MSEVVVFGGYGTFGRLVCRELASGGVAVTVAGRDRWKAEEVARSLGTGGRALQVDIAAPAEAATSLLHAAVAVNCVGSVGAEAGALFDACLAAGCHYVDISESRAGARRVRAADAELRRRGRVAAYGCSSLPGISGALAAAAAGALGGAVARARVTLAIGNRNPKGKGAVEALAAQAGRRIAAPQGALRALVDGFPVALPPPFGRRRALAFETADHDLLPRLGAGAVEVGVVFELRLAAAFFALAARFGPALGTRLVRFAGVAGSLLGGRGTSGGLVQVDCEDAGRRTATARALAAADGQRLAALPAALAAQALLAGGQAAGALTAGELLGNETLLRAIAARGFEVHRPPV